jgi:hypothetical protein
MSPTLSLLKDGVEAAVMESDMVAPTLGSLPKIQAKFHVPHLINKPQNPIMDTLYLNRTKRARSDVGFLSLPPELALVTGDIRSRNNFLGPNIWEDAARQNARSRVSMISCYIFKHNI